MANDIAVNKQLRHETDDDERTPLLNNRQRSLIRPTPALTVPRADEETGRCNGADGVNELPKEHEGSRDVAGVISVLLLGTHLISLRHISVCLLSACPYFRGWSTELLSRSFHHFHHICSLPRRECSLNGEFSLSTMMRYTN
jgi:hypothetical protein